MARCSLCGDPIYNFQKVIHITCGELLIKGKEVEMDLILIREEDGKLIVDEDSLYKFPASDVKDAFELKVASIKIIPPAKG